MLAMHLLCEANGVPSVASWPSPWVVAPHYEFLPGLDRCSPPSAFPREPDVLVTFDLGNLGRPGDLPPPAPPSRPAVLPDHPPANQRLGTPTPGETGRAQW